MEEYRIDIKVRNNLILRKIQEAGYSSISQFCEDNNMSKGQLSCVYELISMRITPFNKKGEYIDFVMKIAECLSCSPDELFTETQMKAALKTNKKTMEVNESQLKIYLEQNNEQMLLEDFYHENQKNLKIHNVLKTLTPREQLVLNMRYGLGDYENNDQTLDEVGQKLDISRERVRQIEAKALRKLRHPSRSEELRIFLDECQK